MLTGLPANNRKMGPYANVDQATHTHTHMGPGAQAQCERKKKNKKHYLHADKVYCTVDRIFFFLFVKGNNNENCFDRKCYKILLFSIVIII